jgi:hypothetical protein
MPVAFTRRDFHQRAALQVGELDRIDDREKIVIDSCRIFLSKSILWIASHSSGGLMHLLRSAKMRPRIFESVEEFLNANSSDENVWVYFGETCGRSGAARCGCMGALGKGPGNLRS